MPINIANGSDLNQPKFPLTIIAGEKAIIKAENIPAVFPAMFLTNKNITNVVKDPITTGNKTRKSYVLIIPPNIPVNIK